VSSADQVHFSKKGRREITDFMAHEFLYDYLNGTLDEERRRAFEGTLISSRDHKSDLQKMRNAIEYTDLLANTMVAENVIQEIKLPSSYLEILLRKLHVENWPSGVKLGLEVIVVALAVVAIALLIPWSTLVSQQISHQEMITLAEMEKSKIAPAIESHIENQVAALPDETLEAPVQPSDASSSPVVANAPAMAAPTAKASTVVTPENTQDPKPPPVAREGFIYRGSISVVNLSVSTAKMVEVLAGLGARKAGQVPLGRLKGNTAYYHMTVPESRLEEVKKLFSQYGELKIEKEKHDRIMPEGIVRIIIDVTEKQASP
jgi:hypothetical protein